LTDAFACVLGDTDLLRALSLAQVPCAVAEPPDEPAHYSRLARRSLDWADPIEQPDALLRSLEGFAATTSEPPVLFYDEDRYVLFISRARERLARHFRFVLPSRELVEDLVDKSRFQSLAERLDLPVPPGRFLNPRSDPPPLDLELPLAVKPRRRDAQWSDIGGGAKALRVDSTDSLRKLWARLATAGLPVLVQQLIPGPETLVESYHVYVDERGDTVGEFAGRKLRTWPQEYGFSTALVTSDAADVLALGRDIVARLEFRGVAKLDFKRAPGPDGRLYLLEINPRFNLWHHLGARAGVNLPALVYADLVGEPRRPDASGPARVGVRWCNPWYDILAARAAGIPLRQWFTWMLGCEAKRTVAWDDPLPLVGAFVHRRMSRLRRRSPPPPAMKQMTEDANRSGHGRP
jgi:D-aspartate ligase